MSNFSSGFQGEPAPEAAARRKRRFAQALVAAPGIILILIALHGAIKDYRYIQNRQRRAAARKAVAEATILETHDYVRGSYRHVNGAGTVGFTTASGKEVQVHYVGSDYRAGNKYQIRYDPENPENCSLSSEPIRFSSYLFGNVPLLVFGLYFLFMAMLLGRRRA